MFKHLNNKNGFTLVEMLVAIAIFSLVMGAGVGLLVSSLGVQRKMLIKQELLSQTSYVMEYMGRAIRMARKEKEIELPHCLTIGRGWNFETNHVENKIKFINDDGYCQQFYLEGGQIRQVKSAISEGTIDPATSLPLTSLRFTVNSFNVRLKGEGQVDLLQPRATLFLHIQDRENPEIDLKIQTTISQRNPDIKK